MGLGAGLNAGGSAVAGGAAIGAGSGTAIAAGTTLITTRGNADPIDFTINSVTGFATGALQGALAAVSGPANLLSALRVGVGGLSAGIASEVSDALHGRGVDVSKAQGTAIFSVGLGAIGDRLSNTVPGSSPSPLLKPVPVPAGMPGYNLFKDLARFEGIRAARTAIFDGLFNQIPLNVMGEQVRSQ